MTIAELTLQNRTMLHEASEPCQEPEDLSLEISHMFDIMDHRGWCRGAGLAANQIGLNKRLIVMDVNNNKHAILNPVITLRRGRPVTSKESCLSYPGKVVKMVRHPQVVVEGFDMYWKPIRRKFKGFAACVAQHEIDHLDGITIA